MRFKVNKKKQMTRLYTLLSLLLISLSAAAQTITINPNPINFGTVYSDDPDTIDVIISNPSIYNVRIHDVNIYGSDFTVSDTFFNMAAGASETFKLIFHPRHNINYNTELVLLTDAVGGNTAIDVKGVGKYRNSYYDLTQNLSEESLKSALKSIISSGYNSLGYNLARDRMFMFIDNKRVNGEGAAVNTLEGVYIGRIITGFTDRQAAQNMGFNTEHTFPQSTFSQNEPQRSDLFHLFPTDANANNVRGNDPFGYVTNPTWQQGGSKSGNGVFEPRDVQKGATARAMLYFLIRYGNPASYVNATQQAVLREWHNAFVPDSVEIRRNNAIETYQNNRNPFIDYPQFAERISSFISNSVEPLVINHIITEDTIKVPAVSVGDTFTYKLILVNDGNVNTIITNVNYTGTGFIPTITDTITPSESGFIELKVVVNNVGLINERLEFDLGTFGSTYSINVIGEAFPANINNPVISSVKLYPNPVNDQLIVDGNGELLIQITDITGKVLISKKVEGKDILNLNDLTTGTYIISIKNKEQHFQQKILKF